MNKIVLSDNIKIENMIYEIRGKQVMLDFDLATLYGCKNGTKEINQAVKNNIEKFPERYCFRITEKEYSSLKSKVLTSRGGSRKGHTVFTEQGVYMLATILKGKLATSITIAIMDAFVVMKNIINTSLIEQKYINKLVLEHDSKIDLILGKLNTNEEINHIFYEGQIYDAYSLLIDILSKAKKEIIIIDNYAGKKLFDIIRNINVKMKIYTENIDNISKEKYEKQYSNIEIINTNIFHDRFIIIDNKVLYHSGASFKDLGKKCFAITKIVEDNILEELLDKLKNKRGNVMKKEYYEAYEDRYKDVYNNNMLWEIKDFSKDVVKVIEDYNITKNNSILEVGCGEGRDTIHLLNMGYHNILGIDYSKTVIAKCNELTNNKYVNNFKSLDIMKDKLNKKYDFIYSVAVIHMFLKEEHRNLFYKFIYEHLNDNGIALVISMGDGTSTYKSNIDDAFKKVVRKNINTNKEIMVTSTSCNIVDFATFKEEIIRNDFKIIKCYISSDIPNFDKCICAIISK